MATVTNLKEKRKDGYRGKKCFQVAYTNLGGRRVRRNFETKKEAIEFKSAVEVELARVRRKEEPEWMHKTVSSLTVGELAKIHEEEKLDHKKDSAAQTAKASLKPVVNHFREFKAAFITAGEIDRYENERRKSGLADSSIRTELAFFASMLSWAAKKGKISKNPMEGVELPEAKPTRSHKNYFEKDEQIKAVENHLARKDPDMRDLFVFMINTCVRMSEALSLEWTQVDDLKDPNPRVFIPLEKCKTKVERYIPLNKPALEVLRRLDRIRPYSPYVFRPFDRREFCRRFGNLTQEALNGVRLTSHACRSTFASRTLKGYKVVDTNGREHWVRGSLKAVAEIGAWSVTSPVLMKIYQEVEEEEKQQTVDIMDTVLSGIRTEEKRESGEPARITLYDTRSRQTVSA